MYCYRDYLMDYSRNHFIRNRIIPAHINILSSVLHKHHLRGGVWQSAVTLLTKEYIMKSNKEYHFKNHIESVTDVVGDIRDAGFALDAYRKCDLDGKTISYRLVFCELQREYEVADINDCLKLIVNDAVLLGEMVKTGAIVEG